ncbi:MAG: rod shape-determining protein MreC [Rubrivivax sp.]|nr:rod shape-determining protein MreC [Rubrivivax sp.]
MPLGTLDRTPPPFFRQGPSALTRLVFFAALAVFLMVADLRLQLVQPLRSALAVVLLPVQRALAVPVDLWRHGTGYLTTLEEALAVRRAAEARLAAQAERAARLEQLRDENQRLRALLELQPALPTRSLAAEVLYEAADPYSRKLFIDRGQVQGVALASPVINDAGVLGQVTRVYPLTSEVTLLLDKDAAIPVINQRTQQRSVAYGNGGRGGPGGLELRFLSGNADVQAGDPIATSGLDGIYPPGLAVGRIAAIERRADSGFAHIVLEPAARADAVRHVLVLQPMAVQLPPRPAAEPASAARPARGSGARR